MARTRTIDADALLIALQRISIVPQFSSQYSYNSYGNSEIEKVIDSRIQAWVAGTMQIFKTQLEMEINNAAVLHGPCMLCAPKAHDVFPEGIQQ